MHKNKLSYLVSLCCDSFGVSIYSLLTPIELANLAMSCKALQIASEIYSKHAVEKLIAPRTLPADEKCQSYIRSLQVLLQPSIGISASFSLNILQLNTFAWSKLPEMEYERERPAISWHRGEIFVISSEDNGFPGSIGSVEKYRTETNSWSVIEPLPKPLCSVAATVFDNSIIVSGGYDVDSGIASKEVFWLNEETNQWVLMDELMIEPHRTCIVNEKLFVFDNSGMSAYIDHINDNWKYEVTVKDCPPHGQYFAVKGKLYEVDTANLEIKCFNAKRKEWNFHIDILPIHRHCTAVCTMNDKFYFFGGYYSGDMTSQWNAVDCSGVWDRRENTATATRDVPEYESLLFHHAASSPSLKDNWQLCY